MKAMHRRLLRLETVNGRRVFVHLADSDLDHRLRAELADWLRSDPAPLPADLRAEIHAFLAAPSGASA